MGFLSGSVVKQTNKKQQQKKTTCNAGDAGLISGLGRSPGGRNDNPFQYSCQAIPWTEEPDRLQSMTLQRVRHDLAIEHART